MNKRAVVSIALALAFSASALVGCGATATPTANVQPTQAATKAPTAAPANTAAATKAPATATTAAATAAPAPTTGGKLVIALPGEPFTLHDWNMYTANEQLVMRLNGGFLMDTDPKGKAVGYLAESWKMSADGVTWDFLLKKGIKFHDGTPLTAADYAWTFNECIKTESAASGSLASLESAEAVDELTLRLHLKSPNISLFTTLTGLRQPLQKAYMDKMGEQAGRQPLGVGPYKLTEWVTGDHITMERNPDFSWGPAFLHKGPAYIQTVEIRFLPEYSTVAGGLESGELDYYQELQPKDLTRIQGLGKFQIHEGLVGGADPIVQPNLSKPPFDDVKVRKAFALAIDRQAVLKVAALGYAIEMRGPISSVTEGYWPGIEQLGYGFDLAQAKALMKEAGYTTATDGKLQKDGKPFKIVLKTYHNVNLAQILQKQWEALGVTTEIQQTEENTLVTDMISGDFEIVTVGLQSYEFNGIPVVFGGEAVGGMNIGHQLDATFDELLAVTQTTLDSAKRADAMAAVQKRMVEQVIYIPLYAPKRFTVLNAKVLGEQFRLDGQPYLVDAYIAK